MKVLIVVDMQNDFITGSLGTAEAVEIVPAVAEKIRAFDGLIAVTKDTHGPGYLDTQEGKNLPSPTAARARRVGSWPGRSKRPWGPGPARTGRSRCSQSPPSARWSWGSG